MDINLDRSPEGLANHKRAEHVLGKLGIDFCASGTGSKSELLRRRAELRRGMDALTREADKNPDHEPNEEQSFAWLACAAAINHISTNLDFFEADRSDSVPAGTVHDKNGKRIGVMLTADDLRDRAKIAAKLGPPEGSGNVLSGDYQPNSLADFFRGVAGMRTSGAVKNALTEGTSSSGGYAVPTVLLPGILAALAPASSLLTAGAGIVMLDQMQAKSFNVAAIDTLPTAAWRSENGAVAESDPTFRGQTITPQSLSFLFKVSRELLADAPDIEQALTTAITQAFAKELDRAGLIGSGTAPEIRGLANIANVNAISNGANGTSLTGYGNFLSARTAILGQNAPAPNSVILSVRDEGKLSGLEDTLGQPLNRPPVIAGWNFIPTSQLPVNLTVGTSSDCSQAFVGNFSGFTYFMREGITVLLVRELYAATGQVAFACHARVDVAAMYPKAFAVVSGIRA